MLHRSTVRRARRVSTLTLVVLALGACSTTYVTEDSTTTVAATTTVPTGTPDVLLPRLVATVDQLSEAIIGDGDQKEILVEAENLWAATKNDVAATDPEGAANMEAMMTLARTAVDRTRPADADKATKFLTQLVDVHLAG